MSQQDTHGRSPLSTKRNLNKAEDFIDDADESLNLDGGLVAVTEQLYRTTLESQDDYLNWSIRETVAACLYTASRIENAAVTPSEISETFELDENVLYRRSKKLITEIGAEHQIEMADLLNSTEYVDRYCDELEVDDETTDRAREILEMSDEAGVSNGKSPTGIAAAAVYNAALDTGASVTQSELSDVSGVSEVTIRNRYQEQRDLFE